MKLIMSLCKSWEIFWIHSDGRVQLKVFRVLLGILLFGFYFSRLFDIEFFYSDSGIFPWALWDGFLPSYRFTLLQFFRDTLSITIIHIVFLLGLLAFSAGVLLRWVSVIIYVLHLSFVNRNSGVIYGVDYLASYFLFYFLLISISSKREPLSGAVSSIIYRMMQIQVCLVYSWSGFEKLRGFRWWAGEGIWYSLINTQLARWDFSALSAFPFILSVAAYLVVLWEVYFPVLVWIRRTRKATLYIGVVIHFGIALALNIPIFGLLMVASYVLFLDSSEISQVVSKLKILLKRFFRLPKSLLSSLEDFGG